MKNPRYSIYPLFFMLMLVYACSHREASLSKVLSKTSGNKIYRDLEEEKFNTVLKEVLNQSKDKLRYPGAMARFYKNNGYQAVLIKRFLPDKDLEKLSQALDSIELHGINPDRFNSDEYRNLLNEIIDKSAIKDLDAAYHQVAQLELITAEKLLHYSSALAYGFIEPQKTFNRYFMETKLPDSAFMRTVLSATDMERLLDSIQPQSALYKKLQQALKQRGPKDDDDSTRTIKARLERLRWRHTYDENNVVYVNIPAYDLTVYTNGKKQTHMKVAVGKAGGHETPVLSSKIHSVQVNPVWNIPESIASKEILKYVQADRFYLANNGIDVIQDGQIVEDSENIDWHAFDKDNLPYRFQQNPGSDNALGRIKFLFKNNSAVYLHDTPAKGVFSREIRAVSHGCVRVGKPLELAKSIFGSGEKYNTIKHEMETNETDAKNIALDPQKWVVLDYQTLIEENNKLIFYPDVYGLDRILYQYIN